MNRRIATVAIVVLLATAIVAPPARAWWEVDGAPLCTSTANQYWVKIACDGNGGAFVLWRDYRFGNADLYVQRVDAFGNTVWSPYAAPVCTETGDQYADAIILDGQGGVVTTWSDVRSAVDYDVYAQRLDANGSALWTFNGAAVCLETNNQQSPRAVLDGAGGVIVAWQDRRTGVEDVYAQRLDLATGNVLWPSGGVAVCTAANIQDYIELVADGAGGAIVTWHDRRDLADDDIYAQRMSVGGTPLWTPDGVLVCVSSSGQTDPKIIPADNGGALVVWRDFRSLSHWDLYAQKIDSLGARQWSVDGEPVCVVPGNQWLHSIVPDDSNGVIVTWEDNRISAYTDIYVQRLNTSGAREWAPGGVAVCLADSEQAYPKAAADGSGGVIVTWHDLRGGVNENVYAQKLNANGVPQWTLDGVAVCTAADRDYRPEIASDGSGGAIITWNDYRGAASLAYAQAIDSRGDWGYPTPVIRSIRDVPNDEGGSVNFSWYASEYDPNPNETITVYTIWRALDPEGAAALRAEGAVEFGGGEARDAGSVVLPAGGRPVIRVEQVDGAPHFWELIDSVDAYHLDTYARIVATAFDSTATGYEYQYYQVIAHTPDPYVFYVSDTDSGYSVDNLPPAAPQCLAGEQIEPQALELSWLSNTESDLSHYHVYRGTSAGFTPGSGNRIGAPSDTMLVDGDWRWDGEFWYKVTAVDIHGNESVVAILGPDWVVAAGDTPPARTFLAQNRPNPFNPTTTIAFGVAEPGNVTIRVYEASGRRVRTLVDRHYAQGQFTVTWNGRDDTSQPAASGVYFYTLETGGHRVTRKLVLLK
jgi:hypothetical protein